MKANNYFLIYGLGAIFSLFAIAPTLAETATQTYPLGYTKQYLEDCLRTSLAEGLAEPEATKLCDCTLAEFQEQYTLDAFKELSAKAETDETAANELVEVGQFCFESLLFE